MKPFKTIDEQIEILKSRGLHLGNESNAKTAIMQYGYYEIINSYKDLFLDSEEENERFVAGTTGSVQPEKTNLFLYH